MDFLYYLQEYLFIILSAVLLFLTYQFIQKGRFDERRRSRFRRSAIIRQVNHYKQFLHSEEDDLFLRRHGLSKWITSERLYAFVFISSALIVILLVLQLITGHGFLSGFGFFCFMLILISLIPKKPLPFYYIVKMFRQRYKHEISNEVYQLYNEIRTNYGTNKNTGVASTYLIIKRSLPYYDKIKPTLKKMLPHLERNHQKEAWKLFSYELDVKEAEMLSIVMEEVESIDINQAMEQLDQKRKEISNSIYNRFTDRLRNRKEIIHVIVISGVVSVFFNFAIVFYMWYKAVTEIADRVG